MPSRWLCGQPFPSRLAPNLVSKPSQALTDAAQYSFSSGLDSLVHMYGFIRWFDFKQRNQLPTPIAGGNFYYAIGSKFLLEFDIFLLSKSSRRVGGYYSTGCLSNFIRRQSLAD